MRLCNGYARLVLDRPPLGNQLRKTATDVYHLFSSVATVGTIGVSGFYCSTLDLVDSDYAIAVGQGAVTLASQTFHLRPDRLCAPAVGLVRRDLQTRAPGVYVVKDGVLDGPLTPAQAAQKLGPLAPKRGTI